MPGTLADEEAKKRMDYAVNYLRGLVPERARRGMKFASNAAVAPWGKVADLLRADSLYDEARQVENITKRWGNIDDQSRGMRKLPFYRSLLMDKYLPRLRRIPRRCLLRPLHQRVAQLHSLVAQLDFKRDGLE